MRAPVRKLGNLGVEEQRNIRPSSALGAENTFNVSGDNLLSRRRRVSVRPELQRVSAYTGTAVTRPQPATTVRP
jgi:hypothetical protein